MPSISETDLIVNKDGSVYHLNLKPGQVSDTILVVGDPSRVYNISKHFDEIKFEMNKREFITHTGTYKGKNISAISTGIGPDNVEIFFTEIDALFNVDLKKREPKKKLQKMKIIRVGTSGALQEDIAVGSHLVSNYAVGLDNLMQFYKLPQNKFEKEISGKIQREAKLKMKPYLARCSQSLKENIAFDMVEGNTITTPGFYAPQGRKGRLALKNPDLLVALNYFHHKDFWLTNFEMETSVYYALGKLFGHETLSVNVILANRIKNKFLKNPQKAMDSMIKKVLDRI